MRKDDFDYKNINLLKINDLLIVNILNIEYIKKIGLDDNYIIKTTTDLHNITEKDFKSIIKNLDVVNKIIN